MIELKAEKRDLLGKQVSRLRAEGFVPAELYGHGIPNLHLSLPAKEFAKVYAAAGEHSIITLQIEGIEGEARPVIVNNIQLDPVSQEIVAADLYQVKMDEKIKAHIPLEFIGTAPAVKEKEGVLVKSMDEIEVEALPADLPERIEVDLSSLTELDTTIYVRDIKKSDKFQILTAEDAALVSISAPKEEEEVVEAPSIEEIVTEGEAKRATDEKAEGSETAKEKDNEAEA